MFVFPLKTSLVGCLWIVLSLFDIVKKMNCSFLSGNGYYTLEWLLGSLIAFGMCSGCVRDVFGMQVFVENKQDRCLFTKLKKCIFPLLSLLQNLPLAYYVATQQVKMYCYSAFAAPKFAFGLFCRDSTE